MENSKKIKFYYNLKSTGFITPIFYLYIVDQLHVALPAVFVIEAVSTVINLAVDIPLGVLADKIGAKKCLAVALLMMIAANLLMLLPSPNVYFLYILLGMLSGAALSGAEQALIRSALPKGDDDSVKAFLFELNGDFYLYTIPLLIAGSVCYFYSPKLPFILQSASFCLSLFFLLRIKAGHVRSAAGRKHAASRAVDMLRTRDVVYSALRDYRFLGVILMLAGFSAATLANHKSIQPQLEGLLGLKNLGFIGGIYVVGNLISSSASKLYTRYVLKKLNFERQALLLALVLTAAYALLSVNGLAAVIAGYLMMCMFKSCYRPLVSGELLAQVAFSGNVSSRLSVASSLTTVAVAAVHMLVSRSFADPVTGNLTLLAAFWALFLTGAALLARRSEAVIYSQVSGLSGKESLVVRKGRDLLFVQKYPEIVPEKFFSRLVKCIPHSRHGHPKVLGAGNGRVTLEFVRGRVLAALPKEEQLKVIPAVMSGLRGAPKCGSPAAAPPPEHIFGEEVLGNFSGRLTAPGMDCFIHGDMHPDNIIVSGAAYTAVDWDLCGDGYAWFDGLTFLTSPALQLNADERISAFRESFPEFTAEESRRLIGAFAGYKVEQLSAFKPGTPRHRALVAGYRNLSLSLAGGRN